MSVPNTFSANTTMSSSQMNANFSTIYNEFNGNIEASNIASGAISAAKLASGSVETAKLADSAVTPAKRTGGFTSGAVDVATAGAKTVSGLAFAPKALKLHGVVTLNNAISSQSTGSFDGTTLRCIATSGSGSTGFSRYYTAFNVINVDPAFVINLTTFALTSDGFTYTVATNSADVTVWYDAFG